MRTLVSGLALGCKYALVALGFVIVFKATGVINFAQASFVLVGGYITFNATNTWGLNFYLALVVAMLAGAVLGMLIERSEEHTSELPSLMRISYAVFCLKKKNNS